MTTIDGTDLAPGHAAWMEEVYSESPIHRAMGLSLQVRCRGDVVVRYDGASDGHNRSGNVAGGAIAEMIDSAVVQASRTMLGREARTVTIELKVNFIHGAKGPLSTHGRIDHLGRSTAVGHARTLDESGRLVALGLVTVSIRSGPVAPPPTTG